MEIPTTFLLSIVKSELREIEEELLSRNKPQLAEFER
jgi:hypothetical protein